jgi:CheY-like chemotaxis protein
MSKKKGLILVVEDEPTIRSQLASVFAGEGFPVEVAENGQVALELLRSMENLPSLIFLDLMMPVMDGISFIFALQTKNENVLFSKIPIVIVSAARKEAYGDVVAFLSKPPEIDDLIELAEKHAILCT